MFSRIVLILAFVLIPFADAIVSFPEPVSHADTAAETVQPKALTGPVLVPRAGNPEDADPPAAVRTTDTQFRTQGATADSLGNDAVSEELRLGAGPSSPAHQQSLGSLVLADSHNLEGRRMRAPQDAGESDSTRVRTTSDRSGIRGIVTWVHPSLAGGLMRDGVTRYDPMASGLVAANSWPLGTVLEVRGPTGRSMMLEVRDTGLLGQNHLDASEADFVVLVGDLRVGVSQISMRVLE